MAEWEWKLESEESSKSMSFPAVLPEGTDYGGRHVYDAEEPLTRYTFIGLGVPSSELALIRNAYRVRGGTYSLTDKLGEDHTGYVTAYRFEYTNGTEYFDVELELTVVTTKLGGG